MVKYKFCDLEVNSRENFKKRRVCDRIYKYKRFQEKESSRKLRSEKFSLSVRLRVSGSLSEKNQVFHKP